MPSSTPSSSPALSLAAFAKADKAAQLAMIVKAASRHGVSDEDMALAVQLLTDVAQEDLAPGVAAAAAKADGSPHHAPLCVVCRRALAACVV